MTIEALPEFIDMQISENNGDLTPDALLFFDNAFQTLTEVIDLVNTYVTVDGLTAPSKTSAQITALEPDAAVGTIWFNTDLSKLQVKTATSTVETITST